MWNPPNAQKKGALGQLDKRLVLRKTTKIWSKAPDQILNGPCGEICFSCVLWCTWVCGAAHFVQTTFWSHSIFNTTIIIIRISKVSSIHTSFALRYTNLSWFMFLYLSFVVLRINFYCLDIVLIHWIFLNNLTQFQEGEHLIGQVLLSNIKSFFDISKCNLNPIVYYFPIPIIKNLDISQTRVHVTKIKVLQVGFLHLQWS